MSEKTQWNAAQYKNNSDVQHQQGQNLIDACPLNGKENALDIGCGDGRTTAYLATKVASVIGIDSSANMIAHAQQHHKALNLTFKEMLAEEIPYDNQFDFIFSSFCLHWVQDKERLFKAIYKALKPGGKLACVMAVRNELMAGARQELQDSPTWQSYFTDYQDPAIATTTTDYKQFAECAGLTVNKHSREEVTTTFTSKETLSNFLRNLAMSLNKLPSTELKDLFMTQYVDLYLKKAPTTVNPWYVTFYAITLLAEKV